MIQRKLFVKQYYAKEQQNTPTPFAEFRAWSEDSLTQIIRKKARKFDIVGALNKLFVEFKSRKKVAEFLQVTPRSERRYRDGTRIPAKRVVDILKTKFPDLNSREDIKKKTYNFLRPKTKMGDLKEAVRRMEWIFKSIFRALQTGAILGEITGEENEKIDIDEASVLDKGIQRYARFYSTNGTLRAEYNEQQIRSFEKTRIKEYAKWKEQQ